MQPPADPKAIASQARAHFLQVLLGELPAAVQAVDDGLRLLTEQNASPELAIRRRDSWLDLRRQRGDWERGLSKALERLRSDRGWADSIPSGFSRKVGDFSLVDDDTIDCEILASRLALAIVDRASFEFTDLRSRLSHLERREELSGGDGLRPHVLARVLLDSWREAGLTLDSWRAAQGVLHTELAHLLVRAYHDTNRWLVEQGVMPEIDLRPMIRRAHDSVSAVAQPTLPAALAGAAGGGPQGSSGDEPARWRGPAAAYEETRLMSRLAPSRPPGAGGGAPTACGQLERLIAARLPTFAAQPRQPVSEALQTAMADVEQRLAQQLRELGPAAATAPLLLDGLQSSRQLLKSAAESPIERATIEIVALLFQSILTEDRLPASVRVWFARLQMPVLRVAITEPDFFASPDHPARKLIDRMGACVMGFDAATSGAMGPSIEAEIKRIVQVVEAYPDTGRQVFQTVLGEFEKFLEDYFRHENEGSRVGVSLAQQVEQRETLSIQYMIELRKMLDQVPVQAGVREFLFQVWADVLAMAAVKSGRQGEQTRQMKRAAADLIWSASAKVTREERGEVIRRLPPLLRSLREGMTLAGLPAERQDLQIQRLNNSLAAAFTAKTGALASEQFEELMLRLEALEELLPGGDDVEIDEALVLDLSGHQSAELEVVGEGGSMPSADMVAWARGIQVGQWFKLDYRGRNEPVQLAWQGMRKHLSLFSSPGGRCVLFQQHRLASFLQAGLLVPADDEALTVRATRVALAKLDADPSRLLD
ncbi:DUF1631 family protein [Caldimonas tepidiphila]|uniref:DUF1631 family protein n=1 Tax=Caldimonas tepidiphila TaxID=2315841 RepID=UPI000E5B6A41|nr:DUF1631 family protein [Caldimonas tepidiphila]